MDIVKFIFTYYTIISIITIIILTIKIIMIIKYFENNKTLKNIETLLEDNRINQEAILKILIVMNKNKKDYDNKDE